MEEQEGEHDEQQHGKPKFCNLRHPKSLLDQRQVPKLKRINISKGTNNSIHFICGEKNQNEINKHTTIV